LTEAVDAGPGGILNKFYRARATVAWKRPRSDVISQAAGTARVAEIAKLQFDGLDKDLHAEDYEPEGKQKEFEGVVNPIRADPLPKCRSRVKTVA